MSDGMIAEEFARSINYWRWCWNCGTRGMDCPVAGRPEGADPRCCPDCWHSDYVPSSLRAELAEARAEIARLTEQREEFERQLFWQRGVDANIVEAARTYVGHEKGRLGITNDETAGAWVDRHNELFRTLVAAVEEGKRT